VGRQHQTDDPDGHGTHVCGLVLGNGESVEAGGPIKGAAPEATLQVQALLGKLNEEDGTELLFGDSHQTLADLLESAYRTGSRIHTNSWGPRWIRRIGQTPYDSTAEKLDNFVWTHSDMVVYIAAGNDGSEIPIKGHIEAQAAAKNCITVGSCDNRRETNDPKYKRFNSRGKFKGDPEKVSVFSSRGPTKEDRIKPDVVAPGSMILSAASRAARIKNPTTCGEWPEEDWNFMTETSMATPLVAGCAAVIRGRLIQEDVQRPSAALIKAIIINGATDLNLPREDQGFGRVNMEESHRSITQRCLWEPMLKDRTPKRTRQISLDRVHTAGLVTFKATLVYTDMAGSVLQFNLNLIVRCEINGKSQIWRGNAESAGHNSPLDTGNNVEQVVWKDLPSSAKVQIVVRTNRWRGAVRFAVI
jgi:serine protease AprX